MEIDDNSRIVKTDDYVETLVDGEVVLMHLETGRFFGLKETGRHLWDLLDTHHDLAALVAAMMDEYDVAAETCRSETAELISKLAEKKLVTVE